MDTREPSLSSSRPPSILSSGWLRVEVSDLLCFYAFSAFLLSSFWFSPVKAPLAFVFLYIVNFGLDSPLTDTSKESKGRFGPFSYFWPLLQKRPRHFGDFTGESSSWHKRNGASKGVELAKRWCFSHQLVVPKETAWCFTVQEEHCEVELEKFYP